MKKSSIFWISYADLMTSLFFIMLVLSAFSFVLFEAERTSLIDTLEKLKEQEQIVRVQAEKYRIIESVEENLKPLRGKSELFIYEPDFKRYRLAFDIEFKEALTRIKRTDVKNFDETILKIDQVGLALKSLVESLMEKRKREPEKFGQISYLIVVSGSASDLPDDNHIRNYRFSYERAFNLYTYWRDDLGIDLDAPEYHSLLEFHIAGNGEGGVGRFKTDPPFYVNERKNQRFLINIIPKIGEL